MAIKAIWEWDTNPPDNDFLPAEGGFPELMARSGLNDALRIDLAELRKHYNDSEWIRVRIQGPDAADIGSFSKATDQRFTITITGPDQDVSSYFNDGRILKIVDGGATGAGSDLITQVDGDATYSLGVTTVNISSLDTIHDDATDAYVFVSSIMRALALVDSDTDFYIPTTNDDIGVQDAVDRASTAGGGTVLLTSSNYTINNVITIDGSKGHVVILGALPESTLRQGAAKDLSELLLIDTNELVKCENVKFNVDWDAQTGGNGYGVRIENGVSPTFVGCQFIDTKSGIKITDTNTRRIVIRDCKFADFRDFGISSNNQADTHQGFIEGCWFNTSELSGANPAAIKVAGNWQIVGNFIQNIAHASLLPRGIWLWNEESDNTGGNKCSVHANTIAGANAGNVRCIEVGGRHNNITGNFCNVGTAGHGIFVASTAGGQVIVHNALTGNVLAGGSGIELNNLTARTKVSGNVISPTGPGNGIIVDGATKSLIGHNSITGGTDGIQVKNSAADNHIRSNSLWEQSGTAIEIGTATDTKITFNEVFDAGTDITDSGTNTDRRGNSFDTMIVEGDSSGSESTTPEFDMSGATGLDMPAGGSAGDYQIMGSVLVDSVTAATITIRLYTGANGTKADTLQATWSKGVDTPNTLPLRNLLAAVDADVKWGLSIQSSASVTYIWEAGPHMAKV